MARPLVGNSADEKQIKEATRREKFDDKNKQLELYTLLQSYEGRKFFWDLLSGQILPDGGSLLGEVFNPHTSMMSYNAGKQAVHKQLLVKINEADPKAYTKMSEENLKREEQ